MNCIDCGIEIDRRSTRCLPCKNISQKGRKHSEESKEKMRKWHIGKKVSDETKKKMSDVHKGLNVWNKGKKLSEETKRKLSKATSGTKNGMYGKSAWTGRKHTEDTKRKMRESAIRYIERTGKANAPQVGRNELELLNILEMIHNITIDRTYNIIGYYPDGYCHETNTIYEIQEPYHLQDKQYAEDRVRRHNIINALQCKFVEVLDEDSARQFVEIKEWQ